MTNGVMDNFLNEEENKYFESNGSNESKIEEESHEDEPKIEDILNEQESEDDSRQGRDSNEDDRDERTEERADNSRDEEEDETSLEESPSKKRDFEKAFKAERHKRKEFEQQAAKAKELEKQLAEIRREQPSDAKIRQLMQEEAERQRKLNEPKEEVPDPEIDPLGYSNYKINKLENALKQHNDYLNQRHNQEQAIQGQTQFVNSYRSAAQEFSKTNPDFKDAYNHLIQSRTEEHLAAGYTKQEADQIIVEEEMAIASRAMQNGVNPAERIYNLAKVRGYNNKIKTEKKDFSNIEKGIKNSKSLKSGGGLPDEKQAGINDIDEMTDSEFDKLFNKLKQTSKGF